MKFNNKKNERKKRSEFYNKFTAKILGHYCLNVNIISSSQFVHNMHVDIFSDFYYFLFFQSKPSEQLESSALYKNLFINFT